MCVFRDTYFVHFCNDDNDDEAGVSESCFVPVHVVLPIHIVQKKTKKIRKINQQSIHSVQTCL